MELRELYNHLKAQADDCDIDSYEVMNAVQKHRFFWKPDKVKTILLAESHVYTKDEDVKKEIYYPDYPELESCPKEYVRVVYCLGAGENIVDVKKNPSKSQFWKIFTACTSDTPNINFDLVTKKGTPNDFQRIKNKVRILSKLKEKGIWLLDASLIALYGADGGKPPKKTMEKILRYCWENYLEELIEKEGFENFIVIGKGVEKALEDKLPINKIVMHQPQSHLSAEEHQEQFKKYQKICNS